MSDNPVVTAHTTLKVSSEANTLLRAWEQKSMPGLASEIDRLTHASSDDAENASDSERLELLEGIAEEMARMMENSGNSGEEADLYCGLLRHLSREEPRPAPRRSRRRRS